MNKTCFYLTFSFFFFLKVTAQKGKDSLFFDIHFKWKSEIFELNKKYVSNNDTLQISLAKFYISEIEIDYVDGSHFKEKNSYHLIDFELFKPFSIAKKEDKKISKISFNIGVDSTASVSGALSGDLDLQNGMYWAWQSGYINMKIEGKSKSCKTRKNAFQFHIGGYLSPYYALRKINIDVNSKEGINLIVDLSKLFENLNLGEINTIMIPGENAMKIADLSTKIFSVE